jgi:hypothetical protein
MLLVHSACKKKNFDINYWLNNTASIEAGYSFTLKMDSKNI